MAYDFNSFINEKQGHVVVGIANSTATNYPLAVNDGTNDVGYGNYIIIRSRFVDPTTGSSARNYFGDSGQSGEYLIRDRLQIVAESTKCALLNTNRQSHFVLRIITREMDGASNLRPDNS